MLGSPMFNIICVKHVDRNMRGMKNSVDPHNAILRPSIAIMLLIKI